MPVTRGTPRTSDARVTVRLVIQVAAYGERLSFMRHPYQRKS